MTEQLHYNIYVLSNDVDDMIYVGSTRNSIVKRFTQHRHNRDGRPLCKHFDNIGRDHFKITLIRTAVVETRKEARAIENEELEKFPKARWLNAMLAYSENHNKTRDNEKKKKNRMDFYYRHKLDPEWLEKERERNRLRMREKRAHLKQAKTSNRVND